MAVMVYKRTVFETRRKPKGLLRPKTRANLKDAQQVSELTTQRWGTYSTSPLHGTDREPQYSSNCTLYMAF